MIHSFKKVAVLILLSIFCSVDMHQTLMAQTIQTDITNLRLPKGVKSEHYKWNSTNGTFTFIKSCAFSVAEIPDNDLTGFYWAVPSVVKNIVIDKNVTITGGFRATESLTIEGKERSTSIIYGTDSKNWALGPDKIEDPESSCSSGAKGDDRSHDCEKWRYGAISVADKTPINAVINVKNLTVNNSRTYAITCFKQKMVVDNVYIKCSRPKPDYHSNSDGIGAGPGSSISNSKIDVWDDAIKIYRDMTITNVTIIHNSNGAPIQLGWGSSIPLSNSTINNLLVIDNTQLFSNLALFSASLTKGKIVRNITVIGKGIKAIYNPTSQNKKNTPLPLFLSKSDDARLNITVNAEAGLNLSAPEASNKPNFVTIKYNNKVVPIEKNIVVGNTDNVNGCGW